MELQKYEYRSFAWRWSLWTVWKKYTVRKSTEKRGNLTQGIGYDSDYSIFSKTQSKPFIIVSEYFLFKSWETHCKSFLCSMRKWQKDYKLGPTQIRICCLICSSHKNQTSSFVKGSKPQILSRNRYIQMHPL